LSLSYGILNVIARSVEDSWRVIASEAKQSFLNGWDCHGA